MKIIYTYKTNSNPIFIQGGAGVQRLLLSFKDGNNFFVYFCDDYLRHTYLNKVINPNLTEPYINSNFKRIELDSEFYYYINFIEKNYNYNGQHLEEKIDGHDLGGAVLIDNNGKSLIL